MVSTPLAWDEVEEALAAHEPGLLAFDWEAALARTEEHGDLFSEVLDREQTLPALARAG
jgi:DNA primase